jgi:hypothetical protein
MSWPIPVFSKIEYPKPISLRVWLPTLVAIATGAVGAVLMLWPHDKPTQTFQFWATLVGAPLVACALAFGLKLDRWEDEQTDAEEAEKEQRRLTGLWRGWSRRHLRIVDAVAFLPVTDRIESFAEANIDIETNSGRAMGFELARYRPAAFRRTRLLHLVATRFADALRARREIVVTLMLDDESLKQAEAWVKRVNRIFARLVPSVKCQVEAQSATGGAQWVTQQVDQINSATRLVIAAQFWAEGEEDRRFSEGAAAFLIEPGARKVGAIFRPMTSTPDTLEAGLAQIVQMQAAPDRLTHVWSTGCDDASVAIRSVLTADPKNSVIERLLDSFQGKPGPASSWIALATAIEATRGAGPQLVAWREPDCEPLYLCMISPLLQKESTV